MVSQFTQGLNSCGGLWDTMQSHCEAFESLMTSVPRKQPLPLEELRQLFRVCYSPAERQLQTAEEETAQLWETVLTSISGKSTGVTAVHLRCLNNTIIILIIFFLKKIFLNNFLIFFFFNSIYTRQMVRQIFPLRISWPSSQELITCLLLISPNRSPCISTPRLALIG